jgi:two-component system, NtrC family, response regulator AtoC
LNREFMLETRRDSEPTVGHDAPRARVLIADDDPEILQLLHDALTEYGYEVRLTTTGVDAIDAVPLFRPDVILVDMKMPGLSGMKVLDALRRAGLTVPVILISGQPPKAREGFFATIKKPFDLGTVARTVAAAVSQLRLI